MNKSQRALIALATMAVSSHALAQDWIINNLQSGVYGYSQGSGAALLITSTPPTMVGIEFGGDGVLYGISSFLGINLYSIDLNTGISTVIGSTGLSQIFEGDMAYDATTNRMFGNYGNPTTNSIYTIDLNTGLATVIGSSAEDDISGLAFDSSGRMWGVDTNTNGSDIIDLVEIDKTNGDILSRVSLGVEINGPLLGLDFNPFTNELFMAMDNGNFYSIDTANGSASLVDIHGVMNASGLAFVVPTPGSLSMLAIAGLCGTRRRR